MYARKLRNRSGSTSVQVIRKEKGRYRVVKTFGTSHDPDEIARFWIQAERYARDPDPDQSHLFALYSEHDHVVQSLVSTITNAHVRTIGPELIFGAIFDRMGFGAIPDGLFRHMVISRLAFPSSKLKTVDYLWRYQGISLSVDSLYRSLDRLEHRYKAVAEAIVHEHTRSRLGTIAAVFYDMTTLHFETEGEDDLRKIGFSKAGKFECPQIMLGLLVAEAGQPLGYDVFEGNTFEGHALLPFLERYVQRYTCARPVVVADAAMLSRANLAALSSASYEFIVGARRRIEAHLCISFVAYAIYKEVEELIKQRGLAVSGARAGELCQAMYELEYVLPDAKHIVRQILGMNPDQQAIYDAIHTQS